jgi:hypothetical protein
MRATCENCGSIHSRCTGHRKSDGAPCGMNPATGADVCRMHGGAAPQVAAAASRRAAEQEAERAIRRVLGDAKPVTNPLEAILQLAGESLAWLEALRDRAQERLTSGQLIYSTEHGQQAAAEIQLYERAMDKAAHVLNLAATKNVEARLTALAERDMARVEAAYQAVWQAGRDGLTLDEARRRAARHLRSVA